MDVDAKKSGDAIAIRYRIVKEQRIHVVDGGCQTTGEKLVKHIRDHYDSALHIDAVIVTHPDFDHTDGLQTVLEECEVEELWMLRPWLYAKELLPKFEKFKSEENLILRLKEIYSAIVILEKIAKEKDIPIYAPFQGSEIGLFMIMAPSKAAYLDLIIASEKSPDPSAANSSQTTNLKSILESAVTQATHLLPAAWGIETFSKNDTSPENNMSVVQYANLCGQRILLTGDAGRTALEEAAHYAPTVGLNLPGVDRFQVPHHGSRHNVSARILNRWLGEKQNASPAPGEETFTAIISATVDDEEHPRKGIVRALIHRGARVFTTGKGGFRTAYHEPDRDGWNSDGPLKYPEEQEE
ncbi:MAG: MBL fold metallo-hydrolase [Leptospira sp.]|nr:MBL fold metallo-hydrolase [Leptospira sp.]